MRKPLFILFLFTAFSHCAFAQTVKNDTILIKDSKGIDNIVLLHSSQKKVRRFKKAKFLVNEKIVWTNYPLISQGQKARREVTYKNDSLGLIFYFSSSSKRLRSVASAKLRLRQITITKNAKTLKGLIIGKSTKQDVIAIFKNELGSNNPKDLTYDFGDIQFTFNEQSVIVKIDIMAQTGDLFDYFKRIKY